MMLTFAYRTADPAILEAKAKDNTESLRIDSLGRAFADLFGATPVFSIEAAPRFVGVTFQGANRPKNPRLWTEPKPGDVRMHPRTKNLPPKLRGEAKKLIDMWNEHYPKELGNARTSHLLAALGLSEQVMQGNGLSYFFDKNNVSWIASTMPLDSAKFEEVKASEFDMARAQWHMWQAEMKARAQQAQNDGMATLTAIPAAITADGETKPANEEQA